MIRVALVDDQQLIRAGFRMVVDSQDDMTVVAEAGDGADAIDTLASLAPPADVALVDVRMPGTDGIAACQAITASSPTKVIILTTFDLDEYVVAAIRAGASGFLLKDAPPEDLLGAVRTVHAGDAVIAPSSTRRLLARVAALPDPVDDVRLAALTDREREVLLLMARGLSNQEICGELHLAEPTVKTHVGRVLAKLGARDRVQAVVMAYEAGLVRPLG
ncbi:response regulator transcription factor [Demequina sp. SYSU T00192]|uniref:Response regulator transcription factor n=1 Tax=Demequina litoralis TaxID=3051660 RepID=A0ABT8G9X0_9MICO|nr:response regulator transcription factor [Demequina sp. SYSU T00192]MDN4475935.1 response regulator transcription factor [Demequina sp. SYSU T00192]